MPNQLHIAAANPLTTLEDFKKLATEANVDINALEVIRAVTGESPQRHRRESATPVQLAAERGNLNILKYLIEEAKADVRTFTLSVILEPNLIELARLNPIKAVGEYLFEAEIYKQFEDGSTDLHAAVIFNDKEKLEKLFDESKTEINQCNRENLSPLAFAIKNGNGTYVKLLLERQANCLLTTAYYDYPPLVYALYFSNSEIVKMLINRISQISPQTLYAPFSQGSQEYTPLSLMLGIDEITATYDETALLFSSLDSTSETHYENVVNLINAVKEISPQSLYERHPEMVFMDQDLNMLEYTLLFNRNHLITEHLIDVISELSPQTLISQSTEYTTAVPLSFILNDDNKGAHQIPQTVKIKLIRAIYKDFPEELHKEINPILIDNHSTPDTVLNLAAVKGLAEVVETLLECGVRDLAEGSADQPLIQKIIEVVIRDAKLNNNYVKIINLLINANPACRSQVYNGKTAFELAIDSPSLLNRLKTNLEKNVEAIIFAPSIQELLNTILSQQLTFDGIFIKKFTRPDGAIKERKITLTELAEFVKEQLSILMALYTQSEGQLFHKTYFSELKKLDAIQPLTQLKESKEPKESGILSLDEGDDLTTQPSIMDKSAYPNIRLTTQEAIVIANKVTKIAELVSKLYCDSCKSSHKEKIYPSEIYYNPTPTLFLNSKISIQAKISKFFTNSSHTMVKKRKLAEEKSFDKEEDLSNYKKIKTNP